MWLPFFETQANFAQLFTQHKRGSVHQISVRMVSGWCPEVALASPDFEIAGGVYFRGVLVVYCKNKAGRKCGVNRAGRKCVCGDNFWTFAVP